MMFLLANWRWLLIAALVALLGVQQIRLSAAQSEISDLHAEIAKSALDAERLTREAVERARADAEADRKRLQAEADAATKASRDEAIAARKRFTDLQRRLQEASDADPSIDAWRSTAVPDAVRVLIEHSYPHGAGGGGADGAGADTARTD